MQLRAHASFSDARDRYRANKRTIDTLHLTFQGAVLTLGLQTVLWALALAVAQHVADKPPATGAVTAGQVQPLPTTVFTPEKRRGDPSTSK